MASGQSARITGLPDSPQGIAWSPDGRRIAYADDRARRRARSSAPRRQARRREWAKPLEIIDKVTYRADGAGYIKPGFDHIFVVDADGGAPRQLTFGAYHDGAPEWTPDGRAILFSADASRLGNRSERQRGLSARRRRGAIRQLTNRDGPDTAPGRFARRPPIAYVGFDDTRRATSRPTSM